MLSKEILKIDFSEQIWCQMRTRVVQAVTSF